jgi:hypothetical protein
MYTIIDNSGKVLYCRHDFSPVAGEISISTLLTEPMHNPYWDFENEIFYDKVEPQTTENE